MRPLVCVVVFAICVNSTGALAVDAGKEDYLDFLVQEALSQNLAGERYWILLGHYKKTFWGNYESLEDGPDFFNSPHGKTDPRAELIATLKEFFKSSEDLTPKEEHPQCNFPARYKWLKTRLAFDPDRLPEQRCDRLESWLADLNPERISLIFASFYMNNPASMFGHTFLRIDKKRKGPEQKLLDYGVNFAASADTTNTLVFIVKGLFGGFKGIFSLFPYYVKIQEYNNLENRDMWEYELSFTEDQMNYLLLHLWELGGNYFDYYYFQENCSYHILSLLEIANPDLYLTDLFLFHVIPTDTVKALTRYPDLISRRVYRPSLLNQMNDKLLRMTRNDKRIFHRLVKNPSLVEEQEYLSLSVQKKALVLDAYLDYAQYRNFKKEKSTATLDPTTRQILLVRSQLDYRRDDPPEVTPFSSPPELGHGSARLGLAFGRNETEFFEQISLRPAYHDLLAKDTGYGKHSQILFLDVTARHYRESKKTEIDNFKFLDIVSLTHFDPLFKKKSWKLSIGVDTLRDLDCDFCNSFNGNYGIGLAYEPGFFLPILFYSLLNVEFDLSKRLDRQFRVGGGGAVGILMDLTDRWKLQATGDYITFPLGHQSHFYNVEIHQNFSVLRDLDLRFGWRVLNGRAEWLTAVNFYF